MQQLESELAEARRLLEVRNAELATLQGGAPVPPDRGPAAARRRRRRAAERCDHRPAAAPEAAAAAEPAQARAKPKKPKKTVVEPPQPSLLERLADYWWVLLGLLAAGLGACAVPAPAPRTRQRRGVARRGARRARHRARRGRGTRRVRATRTSSSKKARRRHRSRRGCRTAAAGAARAPEPTRKVVTVEDTLSGDGPVSIESGDPLAEADFHMAYGLYDQAADLVQLAMKREPQRRDLKLKLLEIYFVWGNKDRFLDLAREMDATRADAPAGEWDKVLIMGKQIAAGRRAVRRRAERLGVRLARHGTARRAGHARPDDLRPAIQRAARHRPDRRRDRDRAGRPLGLDFVLDEPVPRRTIDGLPTIETLAPTDRDRRRDRRPRRRRHGRRHAGGHGR